MGSVGVVVHLHFMGDVSIISFVSMYCTISLIERDLDKRISCHNILSAILGILTYQSASR